jgi:hypothetical protein
VCAEELSLFNQSFTIILFVGSIVVVVKVISQFTSCGTTELTQSTDSTPDDIVAPIGLPAESASCIVT